MKLILIKPKQKSRAYLEGIPREVLPGGIFPYYLENKKNNFPNGDVTNSDESLFYIEGNTTEEQENHLLEWLAIKFPGQDILLLTVVKGGVCPASAFQSKVYTKDGVLPG